MDGSTVQPDTIQNGGLESEIQNQLPQNNLPGLPETAKPTSVKSVEISTKPSTMPIDHGINIETSTDDMRGTDIDAIDSTAVTKISGLDHSMNVKSTDSVTKTPVANTISMNSNVSEREEIGSSSATTNSNDSNGAEDKNFAQSIPKTTMS